MTITVETERGSYPVVVDPDALRELPEMLAGVSRVALIHSANLGELAAEVSARCLAQQVLTIPVPDAEAGKSPDVLVDCWNQLAAAGFTRSDVVLGLGGGAITDLAGFVAASWLRGVGYISIPTSVLGMVDAAVGGKTGINLAAGKNLVGAFYQPRAVLCDLNLLGSLPDSEVSSGLAEVVKCGFISDPEILVLVSEQLSQARDVGSAVFADLVRRAISVKARVVAADLTERTSIGDQVGREALNYGHTLGHAIEARERLPIAARSSHQHRNVLDCRGFAAIAWPRRSAGSQASGVVGWVRAADELPASRLRRTSPHDEFG